MSTETPSINQHDLIAVIADDVSLPKAKVAEVVRAFQDHLATALANGERVRLPLGSFAPKTIKARSGRVAGREYSNPARTGVRFCPSKALKDALAPG